MFIAFSPFVTPAACHLLPSCGVPILFMRLGAPHKIDRCANRCFLYPPQTAVAYVARQRKALFCEYFRLMKPVGANCVRPFLIRCELAGDRRSPLRVDIEFNLISPESSYVFVNYHGGSKPPPYTIGYIIQFVLSPHL